MSVPNVQPTLGVWIADLLAAVHVHGWHQTCSAKQGRNAFIDHFPSSNFHVPRNLTWDNVLLTFGLLFPSAHSFPCSRQVTFFMHPPEIVRLMQMG